MRDAGSALLNWGYSKARREGLCPLRSVGKSCNLPEISRADDGTEDGRARHVVGIALFAATLTTDGVHADNTLQVATRRTMTCHCTPGHSAVAGRSEPTGGCRRRSSTCDVFAASVIERISSRWGHLSSTVCAGTEANTTIPAHTASLPSALARNPEPVSQIRPIQCIEADAGRQRSYPLQSTCARDTPAGSYRQVGYITRAEGSGNRDRGMGGRRRVLLHNTRRPTQHHCRRSTQRPAAASPCRSLYAAPRQLSRTHASSSTARPTAHLTSSISPLINELCRGWEA